MSVDIYYLDTEKTEDYLLRHLYEIIFSIDELIGPYSINALNMNKEINNFEWKLNNNNNLNNIKK